jgi:hypothetical protein
MSPVERNWAIQAALTVAVFAVPYKFWLTTPVLQNISVGTWRLLAVLFAVGFGAGLSLMGVSTPHPFVWRGRWPLDGRDYRFLGGFAGCGGLTVWCVFEPFQIILAGSPGSGSDRNSRCTL